MSRDFACSAKWAPHKPKRGKNATKWVLGPGCTCSKATLICVGEKSKSVTGPFLVRSVAWWYLKLSYFPEHISNFFPPPSPAGIAQKNQYSTHTFGRGRCLRQSEMPPRPLFGEVDPSEIPIKTRIKIASQKLSFPHTRLRENNLVIFFSNLGNLRLVSPSSPSFTVASKGGRRGGNSPFAAKKSRSRLHSAFGRV